MPDEIYAIHKPLGITSHRVAIRLAEQLGTVVTHTGSLDPLAEGVLVLLIGPEAKKQQTELQSADKDYEFDLLFGFSTDTYDPLGLVTASSAVDPAALSAERLRSLIHGMTGKQPQEVPPYSSIVIRGMPLFWWAREGRLSEVGLPVREIEIDKAELTGVKPITKADLETLIMDKIVRVEGDFRQERIIERWRERLAAHPDDRFTVATIRMTVGSGTYIRSLANEIGKRLGIPSLALRILRTRSGRFHLADCRPYLGLS